MAFRVVGPPMFWALRARWADAEQPTVYPIMVGAPLFLLGLFGTFLVSAWLVPYAAWTVGQEQRWREANWRSVQE